MLQLSNKSASILENSSLADLLASAKKSGIGRRPVGAFYFWRRPRWHQRAELYLRRSFTRPRRVERVRNPLKGWSWSTLLLLPVVLPLADLANGEDERNVGEEWWNTATDDGVASQKEWQLGVTGDEGSMAAGKTAFSEATIASVGLCPSCHWFLFIYMRLYM